MERKKAPGAPTNDGRIHYKKVGRGSFRFNGKIIKPGQTFMAYPHEIAKTFADLIIPLDEIKETPPEQIKVKPLEYKLVPCEGGEDLWDVVQQVGKDEKGEPIYKVINEKGLVKVIAETLIRDLGK